MPVASVDGIVLVRNHQPGPATHSWEGPNGKGYIEWGGAGDPEETDVQEVPEFLLRDPNFRRAVARGIYEVISASEEHLDQIDRAATAWRSRQDKVTQAASDAIDPQANNDLIGIRCLGPGARGSQCEETVMVREKIKDKHPALCQKHAGLEHEFVLTEDDDAIIGNHTGGKAVTKWVRMGVTARNDVGY